MFYLLTINFQNRSSKASTQTINHTRDRALEQ